MLLKVLEIRNLSPSAYVLRLDRNGIEFKPGQCANLGLKGSGVNREYSIYSDCGTPWLEFLIKEIPGGLVSKSLRQVAPGQMIEFHGPYGAFVLTHDSSVSIRYTFIGTGTGIAPFHSFALSYPGLQYRLIHGIRDSSEQYDYSDFPRERITSCVSRETGHDFHGRVTHFLSDQDCPAEDRYYLCGNQKMIHEVYDLLRQKGVSGSNIMMEAFF